jgi:aspartokinase
VNVVLISRGASTTNLTFVVAERDVEDVVRQLHDGFFGARSQSGVTEPVA